MGRRDFIKNVVIAGLSGILLAGSVIKGTPPPPKHILYADGMSDDTEAFEAWLRGESVIADWNGERLFDVLDLKGRTVLTTRPVMEMIGEGTKPVTIMCGIFEVF